MKATIEVTGLRKRFGRTVALDGLSFTVTPGDVTGFVGPNGAGKSTTMRVILGLDAADEGSALIGGQPYRSLRHPLNHVGALLDAAALQPSRTARNHLLWLAHSQGLGARRVDDVIEQAGLQAVARRKAGGYSLGMRQRLGIAAALLGDPPVLMLDEPFNGMDPEGIVWMRGFLRALAAQGRGGAGVQPPDERAAGGRRPSGDRGSRQGARRCQRGGPDRVHVRGPGHGAHQRPLGRDDRAAQHGSHGGRHRRRHHHRLRVGGRADRGPARRKQGPVLRGIGTPGDAGRGVHGADPRCGGVPRRARRRARAMSAPTKTPFRPGTAARRDGFAHLLRAEWTKFRTVRGWVIATVVSALMILLLGVYTGVRSQQDCPNGPCRPVLPTGPDGEAVTDTFYFVHRPLAADGSITVRVTSLTGVIETALTPQGPARTEPGLPPWSKAGLIITADASQGSPYAAVMVTGGHGTRMQYNYIGDVAGNAGGVSATSPRWLRLTRAGDTI